MVGNIFEGVIYSKMFQTYLEVKDVILIKIGTNMFIVHACTIFRNWGSYFTSQSQPNVTNGEKEKMQPTALKEYEMLKINIALLNCLCRNGKKCWQTFTEGICKHPNYVHHMTHNLPRLYSSVYSVYQWTKVQGNEGFPWEINSGIHGDICSSSCTF